MYNNIGLLYNKDYFKRINNITDKDKAAKKIVETNDELHASTLPPLSEISQYQGTHCIYLRTNYPGLLAGSGYMHDVDGDDDAYKLGFSFDHTTGAPVIPGSSIKGILRSALTDWDYTKGLCDSPHYKKLESIEEDQIIQPLFGDQDTITSIYSRIVYMDAIAVEADDILLGSDYITPHKNKDGNHHLDDFSNPNPIKFLKVMPDVSFQCNFIIPEKIQIGNIEISANTILHLFSKILTDAGIGAKSNVGYGYMTINNALHDQLHQVVLQYKTKIEDHSVYNIGEYSGTIVEFSGDNIVIKAGNDIFPPLSLKKFIANAEKNAARRKKANKSYQYVMPDVGQEVKISITDPFTSENQKFKLIYNWY